MVGSAGLKMWVHTLIEYDAFGKGHVTRSFAVPAQDSDLKYKPKRKTDKLVNKKETKQRINVKKHEEEIDLWNQ